MKATIARILLVAAPALAACGDDGKTSSSTTATTPRGALDAALWPDPAVASPEATPRAVARSFIVDFLRMKRPPLGEFNRATRAPAGCRCTNAARTAASTRAG